MKIKMLAALGFVFMATASFAADQRGFEFLKNKEAKPPVQPQFRINNPLDTPASAAPSAPEEDSWMDLYDEPEKYLNSAIEQFRRHDFKSVARQIRKVSAIMKLEYKAAAKELQSDIVEIITVTDSLAQDAEKGAIKNDKDLLDRYSKICFAFMKYYASRLNKYKIGRDNRKIGYAIRATLTYFEDTLKWTSLKTKFKPADVLREAKMISNRLMENIAVKEEELNLSLKATLGEEERLEKEFGAKK